MTHDCWLEGREHIMAEAPSLGEEGSVDQHTGGGAETKKII